MKRNLEDGISNAISKNKEIFENIFKNRNVKIERIVSYGQTSPKDFWYDQDKYEFVLLVQGQAEIEFENSKVKLCKNDYLIIEPHKKHRVSYTSKPAVWLTFFFK
jgi:cupin 2 domain-containing protein